MRSYRRQNDDITSPKISVISNTPLKHRIVEELQCSVQIQKSEALALPITLKIFSIYYFFTSEMDTHPPNFLIEFGRITRAIFSTLGGNRPPPCPPLAGATEHTLEQNTRCDKAERSFPFAKNWGLGKNAIVNYAVYSKYYGFTVFRLNSWFLLAQSS